MSRRHLKVRVYALDGKHFPYYIEAIRKQIKKSGHTIVESNDKADYVVVPDTVERIHYPQIRYRDFVARYCRSSRIGDRRTPYKHRPRPQEALERDEFANMLEKSLEAFNGREVDEFKPVSQKKVGEITSNEGILKMYVTLPKYYKTIKVVKARGLTPFRLESFGLVKKTLTRVTRTALTVRGRLVRLASDAKIQLNDEIAIPAEAPKIPRDMLTLTYWSRVRKDERVKSEKLFNHVYVYVTKYSTLCRDALKELKKSYTHWAKETRAGYMGAKASCGGSLFTKACEPKPFITQVRELVEAFCEPNLMLGHKEIQTRKDLLARMEKVHSDWHNGVAPSKSGTICERLRRVSRGLLNSLSGEIFGSEKGFTIMWNDLPELIGGRDTPIWDDLMSNDKTRHDKALNNLRNHVFTASHQKLAVDIYSTLL